MSQRLDIQSKSSHHCQRQLALSRRPGVDWKFVARLLWSCNITLGLLLWFFYFTDYSLPGTYPDIIFPPIVAVFGMLAIPTVAVFAEGRREKVLSRMACLPSLMGGLSFALICCVLFVPPFWLGGMFILDSINSETLTQRVGSPNGLLVAEVYIAPGGYSGAYNRPVYVRIKSPYFPLVERDLYSESVHLEHSDASNFVAWTDNDSLRLSESGKIIHLGIGKPEFSITLFIALALTVPSILFTALFGKPWRG